MTPAAALPGACFQVSDEKPAGLAWDGEHFWIADAARALIHEWDPAGGASLRSIQLTDIKPGALAWDGSRLWCLDADARKIHKLDVDSGAVLATIDAPVVKLRGKPVKAAGLAWDGECLWTGCIAGWSSRMYQIDPADGHVKRWIYSRGLPRALACDGKHLWSAADAAAEGKPGVIFKYDLAAGRCLAHAKTEPAKTVGLAHDGSRLWRLDENQKTARQLASE